MNKKNEVNTDKLLHKFMKLVETYSELERNPKQWGTDERLTSAEIHLIEKIGDFDEKQSVTDLAQQLGITKGAISQRLKKLEKNGLIIKQEDPDNESRLLISLTKKGKTAYASHLKWHDTMDGGYKKYLKSLEKEKIEFLDEYLTRITDFIKRATENKE